MTAPLPSIATELRSLFERFTALSEDAMRACDAGDVEALGVALDAREIVTGRVTVLDRAIAERRGALRSPAGRDAFDASLRMARAAAALAERRNAELTQRAQVARTTLGESIDRLRHDTAAQTAYTAASDRG
ncbi:MAG: hypothetical protein ABI910_11620, partial [Gemmatimonadota bacterium]